MSSRWITQAVTRYQVPELQTMIRSFKEAQETRNAAIRDFKGKLYSDFDADRDVWLRAVRVMAEVGAGFLEAETSQLRNLDPLIFSSTVYSAWPNLRLLSASPLVDPSSSSRTRRLWNLSNFAIRPCV